MKTGFQSSPAYVAGCRMPSGNTIEFGDQSRRIEAEAGSARLLDALNRYFAGGGRG